MATFSIVSTFNGRGIFLLPLTKLFKMEEISITVHLRLDDRSFAQTQLMVIYMGTVLATLR